MNKNISIVSSHPHEALYEPHIMHIFDTIRTDGSLESFIRRIKQSKSTYNKTTFIIKNLICLNNRPTELQQTIVTNVIIDITPNNTCILLTFNHQDYDFSNENLSFIRNMSEDALATPEHINDCAIKILHLTSSDTLPNQHMSIPIIIEEVQKKINMSSVVQKPGALKAILQKKYQDYTTRPFFTPQLSSRPSESSIDYFIK